MDARAYNAAVLKHTVPLISPSSPYLSWGARLVALISYIAVAMLLILIVDKVLKRRSGK